MADPGVGRAEDGAPSQEPSTPRILIGSPSPYPLLALGRLRAEFRTREEFQAIQSAYLIQWIEGAGQERLSGLRLLVLGEQIAPSILGVLHQHAEQALAGAGQALLPIMNLSDPGAAGIAKHLRDGFIPFYEREARP